MSAYEDLILPAPEDASRPYVVINMVSSVNGVASVGGRAGGIGGAADRESMRSIRSNVDAVMVGAGTLRAEKMKLGLDDPSVPQPLAVIVCGPEPPPLSEMLLKVPTQRVLLAIPEEASQAYAARRTQDADLLPVQSSGTGRIDLGAALRNLRHRHGIKRLLVEGGPSINGALLSRGLVDEIFVTISPGLLATTGGRIVEVEEGASHDLRLMSVTPVGDEVFLRYAVTRGRQSPRSRQN